MSGYHVAVVGATGAVGRTMLRVLEEREFPVASLRVSATARSAGRVVTFRGEPYTVEETGPATFEGVQLALFAGGDGASARFGRSAAKSGTVVIDNSSTFRMEPDVPLVIPEVNGLAHRDLLLGRPEADQVEAVTGTPLPLAFNLLPQWRWMPGGVTEEEHKIVHETQKILEAPVPVSVTTVRVPVVVSHLIALHVEFSGPLPVERARALLGAAPGVELVDDPERGLYPTPLYAAGRDACLVGRLRPDPTVPHGLQLVVAADNLRKGAATNAVQIAEALVRDRLLSPAPR